MQLSVEHYFILASVATLVSGIGSLAGFGGGIFIVPLLVVGFQQPIEIAIGVTALSLILPSFITSYSNLKAGFLDLKLLLIVITPLILGAPIGALGTNLIQGPLLQLLFAFFLITVSLKFLKAPKGKKQLNNNRYFSNLREQLLTLPPLFSTKTAQNISLPVILILSFLSGIISGLMGIGGGILITPLMVGLIKAPIKTAAASAIFSILFTSLSGGLSHFYLGHFDLNLYLAITSGFAIGAIAARRLFLKITDAYLLRLVGYSICASAMVLILNYLFLK